MYENTFFLILLLGNRVLAILYFFIVHWKQIQDLGKSMHFKPRATSQIAIT